MERSQVNASPEEPNQNRRRFLIGAGLAGAAAGGYGLYKEFKEDEVIPSTEGVGFESEIIGYAEAAKLGPSEIVFTDNKNVPIGKPAEFGPAIPKELKVDGIPISPPPLFWRKQIAEMLESDPANQGRKVARSHNVALYFKAALGYKHEPELAAGIKSGKIKSYLDIVRYFSQKPVRGLGKEISREDYVTQSFHLSNKVPSIVRDQIEQELKLVIPGLCAKESMFNNSLRSGVGAAGIFQFMPRIWESYGKADTDLNSLKEQTEVAGLLMSDMYLQLMHHIDDQALLRVRDTFDNQADFLKHFITPLIINSYNSGSSRLATAVNQFFTPERNLDGFKGKDLFLAMADYAYGEEAGVLGAYKTDAREYVSRAYALSRVL